MNDALFPDKDHNVSHYVGLEVNGMLLDKELFVSLDGGRYFVPVPEIEMAEEGKRNFYYNAQQVQLAKIVGDFHFQGDDIYKFATQQKKPIIIKL